MGNIFTELQKSTKTQKNKLNILNYYTQIEPTLLLNVGKHLCSVGWIPTSLFSIKRPVLGLTNGLDRTKMISPIVCVFRCCCYPCPIMLCTKIIKRARVYCQHMTRYMATRHYQIWFSGSFQISKYPDTWLAHFRHPNIRGLGLRVWMST